MGSGCPSTAVLFKSESISGKGGATTSAVTEVAVFECVVGDGKGMTLPVD